MWKTNIKTFNPIFQNPIKPCCCPYIWKRLNIIPVHKKSDKEFVKNYRPIFPLSIFDKIFEQIAFNRIYNFLSDEKLLNPNQCGFRPYGSSVNQLFKIILTKFDIKVYFISLNLSVSRKNFTCQVDSRKFF